MKDHAVVKFLIGELDEVRDGLGGFIGVKRNDDVAVFGLDGRLGAIRNIWTLDRGLCEEEAAKEDDENNGRHDDLSPLFLFLGALDILVVRGRRRGDWVGATLHASRRFLKTLHMVRSFTLRARFGLEDNADVLLTMNAGLPNNLLHGSLEILKLTLKV